MHCESHSEETKKKLSEKLKAYWNSFSKEERQEKLHYRCGVPSWNKGMNELKDMLRTEFRVHKYMRRE